MSINNTQTNSLGDGIFNPLSNTLGSGVENAEAGGNAPANGYVAENGTTYYVAEDGLTYYIQEPGGNTGLPMGLLLALTYAS